MKTVARILAVPLFISAAMAAGLVATGELWGAVAGVGIFVGLLAAIVWGYDL